MEFTVKDRYLIKVARKQTMVLHAWIRCFLRKHAKMMDWKLW